MKILVSSPISGTASGQYNYAGGSAKGNIGFSINESMLPEFTIPDLTIEKINQFYGDTHVDLSSLHLKNGLVKSDWSFSFLEMNFPETTIESLSIDWPIEDKKE